MMLSKRDITLLNKKKTYEDTVWESNQYGKFKIVEYKDCKNVLIRFLATGFEKIVHLTYIKTGAVKDDIRDKIHYEGRKYSSRSYGDFEIVEYKEYNDILVRFLLTGYEKRTTIFLAEKGAVKDPTYFLKEHEGVVYNSVNYGKFEVIGGKNTHKVEIRFIDTGYTSVVKLTDVLRGKVRDYLAPSMYNRGVLGSRDIENIKAYKVWRDMLKRCYCSKYHSKNKTYLDCEVSEDWWDLREFTKWFDINYIEGTYLDKDIKVKGNKVYSKDTCLFVTPQENSEEAVSKHYKFVNPKGDVVELFNLSKFCRDNNLSLSCMYRVKDGIRPQYKGWTKYKEENDNAKT